MTAIPANIPVSAAALSRDGKYLAFSDATGSYLRQIDTGETHPLTLPEGFKAKPVCLVPRRNSHSGHLGCRAERQTWAVAVSTVGGSPRKLSDEGREAAVSPDGSQIVFSKVGAQPGTLVDARGWRAAAETRGRTRGLFRSPVWSRDGKHIASNT